jgi:hypothetical protein
LARKTKEADFDITRPSIGGGEPQFSGVWEVFEGYEICRPNDSLPYIRATGGVKRTYRPLADTPHLFLEFARLGEEPLTRERLDHWLNEYGLLGINYDDGRPYLPVYYPDPPIPPLMYDPEGGPEETLEYFALSVQEANNSLSLYEAALNRDEEKLGQSLGGPDVVRRITRSYDDYIPRNPQALRKGQDYEILNTVDLLIDHALMSVWHRLQHNLSNFAYPAINHELPEVAAVPGLHKGGRPFTPHQLAVAWGFRNLLGAMWLQFYWLIDSRADLKRCKFCGRIIPLAPSTGPDGKRGRKPRSDKEYCNKSCLQNYHYHNPKKDKNQSKGS